MTTGFTGKPNLVAAIMLKEEGKEPFFHVHVRGADLKELQHDAMEWVGKHAYAMVMVEGSTVKWDTQFTDVLVCGSLPDGEDFCLTLKMSGPFSQIIIWTTLLVGDLIQSLPEPKKTMEPVDHAPLERARTQGEAVSRVFGS